MENEILLYTDETGKMNVNVRFAEEDVWVTQVQLAEIYATTRQNIGQHIEVRKTVYLHALSQKMLTFAAHSTRCVSDAVV